MSSVTHSLSPKTINWKICISLACSLEWSEVLLPKSLDCGNGNWEGPNILQWVVSNNQAFLLQCWIN